MSVFEKVKEVIIDTLSCDEESVTMEALLSEDLGADSLDSVELGMALEEALGVAIADEALASIKTVADLVRYIEEHAE